MTDISDADLLASLPRGVRNNNPLNVEDGPFARSHPGYKGSDGRFAVFDTMDNGMAAADHNLQGYHTRHGLNTVEGIVNRWAPPSENDSGAYARFVAQKAGVDPKAPLDMADPSVRQALLGAMAEHENGVPVSAPKPADLSSVSDADLLASLNIKPKAAPTAYPHPNFGPVPQKPTAASTAKDVGRSALSGFGKGAAGFGDLLLSASPLGLAKMQLSNVLNMADIIDHKGAPRPAMFPQTSILSKREAAIDGYTPKTDVGKVAQTGASMLPNAFIPGTGMQRILNVVLPTIGQEAGERGAKAAGLDERGQHIAGIVGAGAGGFATGLRPGPAPVRLPKGDLGVLDTAQKAAWAKVDASTYRFPKAEGQAMAADIRALVNDAGPELHPNANLYANQIESLAARGDLTLGKLNRLKSQMGSKLFKGDEAGIASPMLDRVEATINTAKDPSLSVARQAYKRYSKFKDVTERLGSADLAKPAAGTGGNPNTARQKLRPLIDPKSNQQIKNLTADEKAAVRRVVKGTPTQNLLRVGSALDPFHGKIGAMLQTAMGVKTLGASAATIPLGMASTAGEKAIGERNIQQLLDLIAAGGTKPKGVPVPLSAYAFAPAVTAPLLAAPAIAAPQRQRKAPR